MTLYIFERGEALVRKLSRAELRNLEQRFGRLMRVVKNYC